MNLSFSSPCLAAICAFLQGSLFAASLHVDNILGDDTNTGAEASPVKTIQHGMDLAQPGDTVFLKVNKEPYSEPTINIKRGGEAGAPITLDGKGAVLSGLTQYGPELWKDEGNGVYGTPYHFPLRFKQVSMTKDYQLSGFTVVFFDAKPGVSAESLEARQPGGYFLSLETADSGGTLYIKLPPGKTPANTEILMPKYKHTALHVGKSYVTVKNLTCAWTSQDGFSTTKSHDLIFENVRGCYNMDQGMSHHGSQVIIRNSLFDHNGATGVRDVYNDCDSTYEDCVFFENLVAGVDAMGRKHRFVRCLFLDNFGAGISIAKEVIAEVDGCTFKGAERSGVRGWKCEFTVKNSTLDGLKAGIGVAESKATLTGNAFLNCEWNYDWQFQNGWKEALPNLKSEKNLFVKGSFRLSQQETKVSYPDFVSATRLDAASLFLTPSEPAKTASGSTSTPMQQGDTSYGSTIPASLPEKYRNLPSPDPRVPSPVKVQ
jgi:hypothetical protein